MKKVLAMLLVLAMSASVLASCSKTDDSGSKDSDSSNSGDTSSASGSESGNNAETEAPEVVPTVFDSDRSYVYKDSVSTMASNWNPHTYQTNDDAYPADFLRVGLYNFIFNDALHPIEGRDAYDGYVIVPELAASDPVDVTEQIKKDHPEFNIPESATSGYAYTIDLNKDATWEDGTPINAETYVESMKRLLDPKLINYRATDYYSSDLCIAGAEAYANSGKVVKTVNSADAETITYPLDTLVKGDDGKYTTPNNEPIYIGLKVGYAQGSDYSLEDLTGMGYMSEETYNALAALADEDGYVPVTDETLELLYSFTSSDNWGNEPRETLALYMTYVKTYDVADDFSKVGCFASGDYQITLVFGKSLAGFYLYYNLTSTWLVEPTLYDSCLKQNGDLWTSTYNTSVETTKSYGPYKLTSYQADKQMVFERNENWYGYKDGKHIYVDPEDNETYPMYQTTKIVCDKVEEADTRKLMFLKGELMGYGLQSADFDAYKNSEYAHKTPSETIFFFIFNGYKAAIDNREANDGFDITKYDLQTMTLKSFRKAVAVSYDKELLASTISPARSGGYGLIGNNYIYDPETAAKYRDTDYAKQALCDFYSVDVSKFKSLDEAAASITGYDPVAAKALYKEAFDEAIKAGYITDNDNDGKSDQIVSIEYCASDINDFMNKTVAYLNEKIQEVTKDTPFEGKVEFVLSAPYGNAWSDKIKSGMSDVVLGGWSGSALNPFGLSDLYVNPSNMYDAQWFDATSVKAELEVNTAKVGETPKMEKVTMNLREWSDALNGATVTVNGKDYCFGDGIADVDTRLSILAMIETNILQTYDYIPMLQDAGLSLLSQQVYYVVEEYNPIMARGGITYLKYNYDETEWAAYIAEQGGELKY